MRVSRGFAWFAGFTAAFAALAALVFWGAWGCDVAPVMPDTPTIHPAGFWNALAQGFREACLADMQFFPSDLALLLGTPYFRQELEYALSLYFAGLGAVYWCRGRGLSRLASYSAGLLLAFSGYWCTLFAAGHAGWFRLMPYAVFAFGLADRVARLGTLRYWILLAAVAAWGCRWQQDLWLMFAAFSGAYLVWCHFRERRLPGWKGPLAAALAFACIGSTNVRGAFKNSLAGREEQIERSKGSSLSGGSGKTDSEARWIFVTNWSLPPEEAVEFFCPRLNGDTSCPLSLSLAAARGGDLKPYTGALGRPYKAKSGNYRQHSLYVGRVTCLFALAALILFIVGARPGLGEGAAPGGRTGRSDMPFFAVAALLFFLLSTGRYCEPLYRIVFALPFGDAVRCPVKWHHATELCLVFLAAHGIDALLGALPAGLSARKRRFVVFSVAAMALVGAVDLAVEASRFCVPVDISAAKRLDSNFDMTFVHASQLRSPYAKALAAEGRLIDLAPMYGRRDVRLVAHLKERAPWTPPPLPSLGVMAMGGIAFVSSIAALILALAGACGRCKGGPAAEAGAA